MLASQVALVQSSFNKLAPIFDVAARIFYDRLFQLDPSLRRLFTDRRVQEKKLMDALSIIIGNLTRPDRIVPGLRALGRRHVAYGVQNRDYATFGEALLWTLEQGLGDAFTAEARRAWAAAYHLLSSTMKEAAADMETSTVH